MELLADAADDVGPEFLVREEPLKERLVGVLRLHDLFLERAPEHEQKVLLRVDLGFLDELVVARQAAKYVFENDAVLRAERRAVPVVDGCDDL